jgi:hypothetical protein
MNGRRVFAPIEKKLRRTTEFSFLSCGCAIAT